MTIEIKIQRYNPEVKKYNKKTMVSYKLDLPKDSGIMLLKALEMIKEIDPTLGIRRSCGEGVCGSDGMNVNGKNRLTCITRLNQLSKPIVIRPLPGLPVIKDLIVDMNQFYKKGYNLQRIVQNLMAYTNVFYAHVAHLLALLFGGILISLLGLQDYYKHIDL